MKYNNISGNISSPEAALVALLGRVRPMRIWTEDKAMAMAAEPVHLDTLRMFGYLRKTLSRGDQTAVLRHLAECDYCVHETAQMSRFVFLDKSAWSPDTSLLDRITAAVEKLLEPIRPPGLVLQHSTEAEGSSLVRHPLTFEGDQALGSFAVEDDHYRIHIEHRKWPPGTLVLLELLDMERQPILSRFGVLKADWRRSALDLETEAFDAAKIMMNVRAVDAVQLPSEAAALITEGFETAMNEDPDAMDAWRQWAAASLSLDLDPVVRDAAESVLQAEP